MGQMAVKSLARPSFFRMFDLLITSTNPGMKRSRWAHDGVEFERERHSFSSARHGIVIEIFTLSRPGRHGWSLMVTKEYWWAGPEAKPFKNLRWARPLGGQRSDLFDWLRAQESALERSLSLEMPRDQAEANSQSMHVDNSEPSSLRWSSDDHEDEDK
uniref:hypothetical protein n=1 Tax=Bradyrhizobium guangxiense TaxID=1325115 RepID=UPI0037047521